MLMESGLQEAYEYILTCLCKAGLPEGNVFDYASMKLLKFETKWKAEQKKKQILKKYKDLGKDKEKEEEEKEKKKKALALEAKQAEEPKGGKDKPKEAKPEPAKGKKK